MKRDGKTGKKIAGVKNIKVGGGIEIGPNRWATVTKIRQTMTGFRFDLHVAGMDWDTPLYTDSDGWVFEQPQPMLSEANHVA